MGHVLEKYLGVRTRIAAHQLFLHIALPGQTLDILVGADLHKTLTALVVAVPEMLHDPEDKEDPAMCLHEALAHVGKCLGVAGGEEFQRAFGGHFPDVMA